MNPETISAENMTYLESIRKDLAQEFLSIEGVDDCLYSPSWHIKTKKWVIEIINLVVFRTFDAWGDEATSEIIGKEMIFYKKYRDVSWSFSVRTKSHLTIHGGEYYASVKENHA